MTDRRVIGVVTGAGLAWLALADPHRRRRFPRCPTKMLTGLDCPGCGGMRMAHDLLHGDVRGALHDNAFLLVGSPLFAWLTVRDRSQEPPPEAVALAAGAALAWMLLRNLPQWPLKPAVAQ